MLKYEETRRHVFCSLVIWFTSAKHFGMCEICEYYGHYDIIYMKNNVMRRNCITTIPVHMPKCYGSRSSFEIHFLTSSSLVVVTCNNFLADNPTLTTPAVSAAHAFPDDSEEVSNII